MSGNFGNWEAEVFGFGEWEGLGWDRGLIKSIE